MVNINMENLRLVVTEDRADELRMLVAPDGHPLTDQEKDLLGELIIKEAMSKLKKVGFRKYEAARYIGLPVLVAYAYF